MSRMGEMSLFSCMQAPSFPSGYHQTTPTEEERDEPQDQGIWESVLISWAKTATRICIQASAQGWRNGRAAAPRGSPCTSKVTQCGGRFSFH